MHRATTLIQTICELLEGLSKDQLYALKARSPKVPDPEDLQKFRKEAAVTWRQDKAKIAALSFLAAVKEQIEQVGYTVEFEPGQIRKNQRGEQEQDYDVIASIEVPLTSEQLAELRAYDLIKTFISSDRKASEFLAQLRRASREFKKSPTHKPVSPTVVYADDVMTLDYDHKTFLLTIMFSLEDLHKVTTIGQLVDTLVEAKKVVVSLADYGKAMNWGGGGQNPLLLWYADAISILKGLYYTSDLNKRGDNSFIWNGKVFAGNYQVSATRKFDLFFEPEEEKEFPPGTPTDLSPYQFIQFFKEDDRSKSFITSFSEFSKNLLGGNGQNEGSIDRDVLYKDDALQIEFFSKGPHIRFVVTFYFTIASLKKIPKPSLLPKYLKDFDRLLSKLFIYFKEWFKAQLGSAQPEIDYDKSVDMSLPSSTWRDHVAKEHALAGKTSSDVHAVVRSLAVGA